MTSFPHFSEACISVLMTKTTARSGTTILSLDIIQFRSKIHTRNSVENRLLCSGHEDCTFSYIRVILAHTLCPRSTTTLLSGPFIFSAAFAAILRLCLNKIATVTFSFFFSEMRSIHFGFRYNCCCIAANQCTE